MKTWVLDKFVTVADGVKEAYIQGEGETLADAIRDSGIRCETCEHWRLKAWVTLKLKRKGK